MSLPRRTLLIGAVLALAVVVVALLAACGGDDDGAASANPSGATADDVVTVELAEESGSGESGTATLTAMGERTRVVLELTNPTTDSQPAHIHEGSCGPALNPEPLHGLLNVQQGRSETVVNRPLSELTAGGLAINVHESDDALDVYVACGNLPGGADAPATTGDDGY
jgi:hypothetical protein